MATFDFSLIDAVVRIGPDRQILKGAWADASPPLALGVMRRPSWKLCEWCGHEPRRATVNARCWRCNHQHGMPLPPTRWWLVDRHDVEWWSNYRADMVFEAFGRIRFGTPENPIRITIADY